VPCRRARPAGTPSVGHVRPLRGLRYGDGTDGVHGLRPEPLERVGHARALCRPLTPPSLATPPFRHGRLGLPPCWRTGARSQMRRCAISVVACISHRQGHREQGCATSRPGRMRSSATRRQRQRRWAGRCATGMTPLGTTMRLVMNPAASSRSAGPGPRPALRQRGSTCGVAPRHCARPSSRCRSSLTSRRPGCRCRSRMARGSTWQPHTW
jgi:hypothetical protein